MRYIAAVTLAILFMFAAPVRAENPHEPPAIPRWKEIAKVAGATIGLVKCSGGWFPCVIAIEHKIETHQKFIECVKKETENRERWLADMRAREKREREDRARVDREREQRERAARGPAEREAIRAHESAGSAGEVAREINRDRDRSREPGIGVRR